MTVGAKQANPNASVQAPRQRLTASQERKRVMKLHKSVRFAVQVLFFILTPAVFSGTFSGVKYLFTQLGTVQPLQATSFVALLVAVLVFTIVFGRFFCGYACAFGTLGDVLYAVFEAVRAKTPVPRPEFPALLVRILSLVKYVVLAGVCVACFFGVWGAYSGFSPWVAFAGIFSGSIEGVSWVALGLLAAIVVGMIVRERFFCQFLCPLGALFSLMPVLGVSEFVRTRGHCAPRCGKCHDACPVDIWPDPDTLAHGECISCGRCADACPLGNVNYVALERGASGAARVGGAQAIAAESSDAALETNQEAGLSPDGDTRVSARAMRPVRKTKDSWLLWRGTGVGYTLAKAALLLALCWVMGAMRYVPAFSEIAGHVPLPF